VAPVEYVLEHFYYGQLNAQGELRLLAASPGVKTGHVSEAMHEARLPQLNGTPKGALALVRGKTIPFILVQAMPTSSSQALRHFVLLPVDVMRSLGGNLSALLTLVHDEAPPFGRTGRTLALLKLEAEQAAPEAQEDAMLALMAATRDRLDVIEALLAAIIQSVPIVVQDAPADLVTRLQFIEGLLALLPPPARFGVTFATHSMTNNRLEAQIRFMGDEAPPEGALVYHWQDARVTGKKVKDEYSRFIKSQLRLDTGLVLQQTTALTAVAAWRIKRGDSLADALKYAAYRLKLDNAVLNSQPVATSEVARALAEDPTLTEELRAAYVRHLLAFTLALDEMSHADLLAVLVRGQPDLERVVLQQMNDALVNGKAEAVYKTLVSWLKNPTGFKGMYWLEVAHRAALAYAESLAAAGNVGELNSFLHEVSESGSELAINAILPQLSEIALPLGSRSRALAETVFLLAAGSLATDRWQTLLTDKALLAQLPAGLSYLMAYMNAEIAGKAPSGLLARAAAEFGEEWGGLLIIRLVEIVLLAGRNDLIDAPALAALAKAASTHWGDTYDSVLRWMVRNLSRDDLLPSIPEPGPRCLLQILLARRAYAELVTELARQGRVLYPSERQLEFAGVVRTLFLETPLPPADATDALHTLQVNGLKPLPLVNAYFGTLERHQWHESLERVAGELTTVLFDNRIILESMTVDPLMDLLDFFVKRRDITNTVRLISVLPTAAVRWGEAGITPLIQMYRMMQWDDTVSAESLQMLRRYVRRAPEPLARQALIQIGEMISPRVRQLLEASFIVRRLMGGEALADYAYSLNVAARFLSDTGMAYLDKNRAPSLGALQSDLDSLTGGLTDEERQSLSTTMLELARLVHMLGAHHRQTHPRENEPNVTQLLTGKGQTLSAIDIFRVLGGYFGQGYRVNTRGDRGIENHPLADRAAPILLREVQLMNRLLRSALRAVPADVRFTMGADVIRLEIESLWKEVSLQDQRALSGSMAADLQRIPELLLMITERVDKKLFQEDSGLVRKLDANRQRPENTLEFYRFIHGYFKARMR